MKAIAAVNKNLGIGKDNGLLYSIPDDKKFFRRMTLGKVVVMGRKTLESMPGGKPLKDRTNIVLSRDKKAVENYSADDVFVIGGAEIYRLLLPLCDTVYVTEIEDEMTADKFFPDIVSDSRWKLAEQSDEFDYEGIKYKFCTYEAK